MSELLPPITGTGVLLRFVFPFDGSVPRDALIIWQRQVGGSLVEEKYASISQAGASTVVHEQITFPGDVWAVRESGGGGRLLALHVATGEREQQVVIGAASMAASGGRVRRTLLVGCHRLPRRVRRALRLLRLPREAA